MFKDKAKIKGKITASVISLSDMGKLKLQELHQEFPNTSTRKADPIYQAKHKAIYARYGHQKRRETWNPMVIWTMIRCFFLAKWKDMVNVYRFEMGVNHNIVTDEGDAMIADLMQQTPVRVKVSNTSGYIAVGTGWTGTTPKANGACNTITGAPEVMDATYPKLKGSWGAANDNVVQYRSTFEAGDLNAAGINEACLGNNITPASGDALAYGQITPSVTVGTSDTLQVDWELTILGA